jgi:hypothetical protein
MYFQANHYLVFFIFIHGCKGKAQLAVGNQQWAGKPLKWMKLMIKKGALNISGRLHMRIHGL